MATLIGGAGTGILDSSLYLLNRDDRTRAGQAGHKEDLYINISNGDLVIQHQDAWMPSSGEDFNLVRTYNSRGQFNTNVGKGWTLTAFLELDQITANIITLVNPDSSQFLFNFDAASQSYISVDGAGAYERIVQDKASKTYVLTLSDQTVYTFDNNGTMLKSRDTNGNTMTYSYAAGKLMTIQDDSGHTVTFVYSGANLVQVRDESQATLASYAYDGGGRLVSATDRMGLVTRYAYFTNGDLQSISLPSNPATGEAARVLTFTYGPDPTVVNGQTHVLNTLTDAEGGVTTFTYAFQVDNFNKYNGGTTTVLDALGFNRKQSNAAEYVAWRTANGYYATWSQTSYNTNAAFRAQADEIAANHSTIFTYDKNGEILSVTQRATVGGVERFNQRTEYVYDTKENLTAIVDANGFAITHSDDIYYRNLRRDFGVVDLAGQGKLVANLTSAEIAALKEHFTTHLAYDASGNLVSRTDNEDNLTTYTYTAFNKLATMTAAMGNALVTRDDQFYVDKRKELGFINTATGNGKLVAQLTATERQALLDLFTTRYAYDSRQNVTQLTNAGGDVTRFEYDAFGNQTKRIVFLDATDLVTPAKQQVTQFFYDAFGNNVKTIDAEGNTSFSTFDHFGNRTSFTDGRGGLTVFTYDADNRLLTARDPEGNLTVNAYDSVDNRISARDANGHTVTYVYDRNNMLLAMIDPADTPSSSTRQTQSRYDVVGNRTAVTDANGNTTTYTFREDRRLIDVATPQTAGADGVTRVTYHTTYAYDAVGNHITVVDNNGNQTRYVYNGDNLVKETTDALGDVRRYTFDADLNQVSILIGATLPASKRRLLTFSFDEEDQLIKQVDAGGNATSFVYDAPGNRVRAVDANGNATDFVYDRNNRLIREIKPQALDGRTGQMVRSTVVHAYDANGNQISTTDENGNVTTMAFDKDDRGVLITDRNGNKIVYRYDSRGNRTDVMIGVAAHLDAQGKVVVDSTSNAQVTTFAYDEFNQLVAKTDGVGNALVTSDADFYRDLRKSLGFVNASGQGKLVAQLTAADKVALLNTHTERYAYDRVGNRVQLTDNLGRVTRFAYDEMNRMVARTDALGGVFRERFDGNGNCVTKIDELGRTVLLYRYDALDRRIETTDGNGARTTRLYDNVGNLLSETAAAGTPDARTTTYVYDLNNLMLSQTSPEGNTVSYEYDAVGNRLKVTDARGFATRYVYDARDRVIKVTDPLNFQTRTEYDGVGNAVSLFDARGGVQRVTYDAGNRLVKMTDREGRVTSYQYDARGNRVAQTTGFGTPSAETTSYAYDAENNLVAVTDAQGAVTRQNFDRVFNRISAVDGNGNTTSFVYDALNRQIKATDAEGEVTRYTFDAVGNRLTIQDALNNVTSYQYDGDNRMIRETTADGVQCRYAYDAVGNKIQVTRAANTSAAATTTYRYDRDNRLVEQVDALGQSTRFEYDRNGNHTRMIDRNGHATAYEYDADNRVTRIVDAQGNAVRYVYDGNGNRVQVIDGRGFTSTSYYNADNEVSLTVDNDGYAVSFVYDKNHNVVQQTLYAQRLALPVDPAVVPVIAADPQDQVVQFTYDRVNRMIARVDGEGNRTEYSYDSVGNRSKTRVFLDPAGTRIATTRFYYDDVNRLVTTLSAEGYITETDYDAVGNTISLTRFDQRVAAPAFGQPQPVFGDTGHKVRYAYDALNRVVSETNAVGVVTNYQYDARGNRLARIEAAGTPDQRSTSYKYDAADRLTDVTDALGRVTHMALDAEGNVLSRFEAFGTPAQRLTTFTYDGNNRVISERSPIGVTTSMTYDATGNVLSRTVTGGVQSRHEDYSYDGDSRLVSTANAAGERSDYAYDAAGNRTRLTQAPGLAEERTNTFEYDRANRYVATTDAEGVRTLYRYDGAGNKIETVQAAGLPAERHSFYGYDLDNRLIQVTDPEGGVTRYEYDVLGNQVKITDANGGVRRNTFDLLGRLTRSLSAGGVLTANSYDRRDNVVSTTQSFADGTDSRTTTYAYDLLNHQVRVTNGEGFSTSIAYDAFGNQTLVQHGQYLLNPGDAGYDASKAARAFVVTNSFTYDAADRMLALTDGEGAVTAYTYDAFGNRLTKTEAANTALARTTSYSYDAANRLIETRTPAGGIAREIYDAVGNRVREELLQSGDATAGVWVVNSFEFDRNGRQTAQIDPFGTRNETLYDALGNVVQKRFAAGTPDERSAHMEYDRDNRLVADTDGEGNRRQYAYDAVGNRIKVVDAEGRVAHYYFSRDNRLVALLDPTAHLNTFAYDSAGNTTEARVWMNAQAGPVSDFIAPVVPASPQDRVTRVAYDRANREIQRVEPDGATTNKVYNGADDLITEIHFANTASPRTRTYAYDHDNRVIQYTDVDGTVTSFGYDAANNQIRQSITSATDPNHERTTLYEYDLNNRKVRDIFDPAGLNIVQVTAYDRLGNVVRKTDGNGNAITYTYDLNNRLVTQADALGETRSNAYDRVGNVVRQTDARGFSTDFLYDDNNRIVQVTMPSVEVYTVTGGLTTTRPTTRHAYDAAGNEVQTVDANGNLTTSWFDANNHMVAQISGDNVLRTSTYNAAGDKVSDTLFMTRLAPSAHNPDVLPTPPAGESRTTDYEFDLAGRLTRTTFPAIQVTSLSGTGGSTPVSSAVTTRPTERALYDAFGNKVETFDRNGNHAFAWFDVKGREVAAVDGFGYLTEFDYDAQDNVIEQRVYTQALDTSTLSSASRPVPPGGEVFVTSRRFDAASRVVEERAPQIEVFDPVTGLSTLVRPTTDYTYDQVGNQLTKTIGAGTPQAQVEHSYYDAANRRVAVISAQRVLATFAYDANGNLTSRARFFNAVGAGVDLGSLTSASLAGLVPADASKDEQATFTYDAMNRQVSQSDLMGPGAADDLTQLYRYDGDSQRTFLRDEDGFVTQTSYDGVGQVVQSISPDGSGTLAEYDAAGNRISVFTGKIDNHTTPATNIALTLGDDLKVSWLVSGAAGTQSYVVYDSVSRADVDDYANRSAIQSNVVSNSAQVHLPSGAPGTTLFFRVVTQDIAGNRSWTAEQSVTFPTQFDTVQVERPSPDSVAVRVHFDGAVSNPQLFYGPAGNTTNSTPFVLQADGSYLATITGVGDAQAVAFRISWQDAFGNLFSSSEQPFEARADQIGVTSEVTQGTVSGPSGTSFQINVALRLPTTAVAPGTLVDALYRRAGSNDAFATTAAEGSADPAGFTTFNLVLGQTTPLAAGTYEVKLRRVNSLGAVVLQSFNFTVGPTATPLSLQGATWIAPPAGTSQFAVVNGRPAPIDRVDGRILLSTHLAVGETEPYTVYYTTPAAQSHTLDTTSAPVFEQQPDPDHPGEFISVLVGFDLGVTETFSPAEDATISGPVTLSYRLAGSTDDFAGDVAMVSQGNGAYSAVLPRLAAGQYELKISYFDTTGRQVFADYGALADTAQPSASITSTSQTVVASETGGFVSRDANGIVSVDPGLYVGPLDADRLKAALSLATTLSGPPAGTEDADGRTTGYFTETQYNALNMEIASNKGDGLWRTFGVDANGNVLETRLFGDRNATTFISSFASFDARNRKSADFGAPAATTSGVARPVTRFTYNVQDLKTSETNPLGQTRRYEYNALGTLVRDTDALGRTETTRVDIFGNTTATVSKLGNTALKFYDAFARLIEDRDGAGRKTDYAYDSFDRRTEMVEGRGVATPEPGDFTTRYQYDQRDRLIQATTAQGFTNLFAYDGRNNRTATTDANGHTTTQTFDPLGRVASTSYVQGGSPFTEFRSYDAYGNEIAEVDALGRTQSHVFGGFSREAEEIDQDGNQIIKEYDLYGRLVRESSPQTGKDVRRTYDDAGQLLSINDVATGVSTVYTYDLAGRRISETTTTPGDANDRTYTYQYDALGRMVRWADGATGLHLNQLYDADGNLARAFTDLGYDPLGQNTGSNPNFRYVDHLYRYDGSGKLVQLVQQNIDAAGNVSEQLISSYGYDAGGNRIQWNNAGVVVTYTYDADGRVTNGTFTDGAGANEQRWQYDAVGNVVDFRTFLNGEQKTVSVNQFDEQNHSIFTDDGQSQSTKIYDGSGRQTQLVLRQQGKTFTYNFTYFGDGRERNITAFGDANGNATSTYDANKVRVFINQGQGDGQNRPETKSMVIDNEGHILNFVHDDGKSAAIENRRYVYGLDNPTGETGNGVDGVQQTFLDSGRYSLVINLGNEVPATSNLSHTVIDGETLQGIASGLYGNPSLWFVLAAANGLSGTEALKGGTVLRVPNNIQQGLLTSDTHKVYNEQDIVGTTLPNLKTPPPPPPKKKGCGNILMIIIIVVIAVVATVFTAGLAGVFLGAAGTFLGLTGAAATIAAFAVAGAIVGAVASIVQQGLFIALGYQEKFSWKQVASGAVAGAFSGAAQGVGAAVKIGQIAAASVEYAKVAAGALQAASVASKQLIENGKITSWTSLAAAAIGGAASVSQAAAARAQDIANQVATTGTAKGFTSVGEAVAESTALGEASADLSTLQFISKYVTPWTQVAETYVRTGQLKPIDWANAAGTTLSNAVVDNFGAQGAAAGTLNGQLQNAALKLSANLLVGGVLASVDRDAAQGYIENAVGQEVGQFLGDQLGRSLQGYFDRASAAREKAQQAARAPVDPVVARREDVPATPLTGGWQDILGVFQDAFNNPLKPIALIADSGQIMTDVSPGLLGGSAGVNDNQTPELESRIVKQGDSFWNIAKGQLGPDATNEEIQRQVYALMELNPNVDPRRLQPGQQIVTLPPNGGLTIAAGTVDAYKQSDADYQGYRQEQANILKAQAAAAGPGPENTQPANDRSFTEENGNPAAGFGLGLLAIDPLRFPAYLFGQQRVSPEFGPLFDRNGNPTGRPDFIGDRSVDEVARDIEAFKQDPSKGLDPAKIGVEYYIDEGGRKVVINNRSTTALSMAGESPTNVERVTPDEQTQRKLDQRISEMPGEQPSTEIRVTETRRGPTMTNPETGKPWIVEVPDAWKARFGQGMQGLGTGLAIYGAGVDGYSLGSEINKSLDTGQWSNTAREATRIGGGWGGAWAGAEAGAALGLACGPAAWVCSPVGGLVGGYFGYKYGSEFTTFVYDVSSGARKLDTSIEPVYYPGL